MTVQELRRMIIEQEGSVANPRLDDLLERLRHRPFWYGNSKVGHMANFRDCCFNHVIGLPEKQGTPKPIFDYEQLLLTQLLAHGPIPIQDKLQRRKKKRKLQA